MTDFQLGDIVTFAQAPWYFGVVIKGTLVLNPWVLRYGRSPGARPDKLAYSAHLLRHWPEDWSYDMLPDRLIQVSTALKLGVDINDLIT